MKFDVIGSRKLNVTGSHVTRKDIEESDMVGAKRDCESARACERWTGSESERSVQDAWMVFRTPTIGWHWSLSRRKALFFFTQKEPRSPIGPPDADTGVPRSLKTVPSLGKPKGPRNKPIVGS